MAKYWSLYRDSALDLRFTTKGPLAAVALCPVGKGALDRGTQMAQGAKTSELQGTAALVCKITVSRRRTLRPPRILKVLQEPPSCCR